MTQVDNTRKYTIEELPIDTSGWELKKLRQFVGHDTNMGFSAELYIDGKYVADVEDDAMGGGMYIIASKDHREMLDKMRETLKEYPEMFWSEKGWANPSEDSTFMSWDVESIIEVLIQREDERKYIKKQTTKCIFFTTPDTPSGSYRTYKRRAKVSDKANCALDEERLFNHIMKKHPEVTQILGLRTREDWRK
tara:strand:+ start:6106 stop:6684 length:579 start_codon:yes stop_codon:yes gene_type:complete